ncbi:hypothetical protein [Halomarina oriensis]|uniref:Uncharacterized protein n=1 Tax=Halomarina oriensis TaxID=671145 RepID=A0A6B0GIM6_9EURY|nr:hypothetical protein [Halomarina oriensis]MWG33661.1 hypothetical protein [Halomarina oriensis]
MEDSRQYLRQASEQLDAGAARIRDVGTRSTVSFLASELDDVRESLSRANQNAPRSDAVARGGTRADVERLEETLVSLEGRLSGSAGVSVRKARRNLERYERASETTLTNA